MEQVRVQNEVNTRPSEITKKDVYTAWIRWWFCNTIPQSVERFLAPALTWALVPILRKLYKDDEQLKAALKRQLLFFNTQLSFGGIIIGLMASMEKERARQEFEGEEITMTDDLIYNSKAGLMGALAGVGDAIDSGTIQFILISIFLPFTMEGNPIGALGPFLAFAGYQFAVGFWFTKLGFEMGDKAASVVSGPMMTSAIEMLSILGLFMMGILGGNFVRVSSTLEINMGNDNVFNLQQTLDRVLPGFLPLALIMGLYFYFNKKGMKITTAMGFLAVALGILAFIGIL
ncbi:MAG: PTS system mannose/fructose/sorbose family transporter subunit IID [Streptococcaceae bacterium]|jgi:PTS system mannose-specific IID component|nr:PTS system mannose/fructose/sorbose family transporter subunit IID [Streptococcaceae bacterium]